MKRLSVILFASLMSCYMYGQTKLTSEQQKQIIDSQSKSMKLLSKEMKSEGVMYFKKPDKLRWQYMSPYDYTFILNGDKVGIKSQKSTKNIDVQGNKMFRQITNIILRSITGGGLKSSADFTVELYKTDKEYFAKLYPKKKELKQIYRLIEIHFNPQLTMVNMVKMEEKTGDVTIVKLTNIKPNATINEKIIGYTVCFTDVVLYVRPDEADL